MDAAFIQELCKGIQTPTLSRRFSDATVGIMLIFGIQLLVVPTQIVLDLHSVNLPASILTMFFALITMSIAGFFNKDTGRFYHEYLQGPTDFLGRHMSFGFVAFFVLLIQDHIDNSSDIPSITGVFVVTTIISYVASFVLAFGGFRIEQQLRRSKQLANDIESNNKSWPSPSIAWPAPSSEPLPKRISQLSALSKAFSAREPLMETAPITSNSTAASINFAIQTAPIWIWLSLLVVVGIPVYLALGYMMPSDVFALGLFWVLSIQFQRSLRSPDTLSRSCRLKHFLFILANPVLTTWALATAYMWAKALYTRRDIAAIIGEFRHYNSLTESIIHIMQDHDVRAHLGAGDLAGLLLDAGVTCLGFKMYEYRSELWVSLGTVSFTCAALAPVNVFLNVIVGRGFGLRTKEAIAFAGRSATLALGVPAIDNLGGSTTLTSTVAIFGGVLFQMTGDQLFSLLCIDHQTPKNVSTQSPKVSIPKSDRFILNPTHATKTTGTKGNKNCYRGIHDESRVVAAGITVGINAAAMGTSYLIERDSRATAYSALSMIMFGAATVVVTALPGAAEVIISLASR
ncbi:hypothetical protein SAMD00023353_2801250 [Rosellinia necatrix]|uniref:LrgB-like protein n=1 Tax=Rosellinia necatrix TaxID=77044 RepID=A0A1W2TI13_ROSNE|nr:hypothetical protein SAMD00023353_2801250 [Rosellinia necatrix]